MKSNERKITVKASGVYDVVIANNLIDSVGELILSTVGNAKIAVITDDVVDVLYADRVINSLTTSGFEVVKYVFPHGEESKNLSNYGDILEFLSLNHFTRSDVMVALGGGVVGDITGFSAATYMRGIKYIQIPTTLLAQIDSSVGGKTAVDLPSGKNLVGAFKQPSLVICDVDVLADLPKSVLLAGYGEMLKYAILDKKVYDELMGHGALANLVSLCVEYKRNIVELDEKESNERRLLNLGHTSGHAIEKLSNFTVSHGIGVAYGLKIMAGYSLKKGYIDKATFDSIVALIDDTVTLHCYNTHCTAKLIYYNCHMAFFRFQNL